MVSRGSRGRGSARGSSRKSASGLVGYVRLGEGIAEVECGSRAIPLSRRDARSVMDGDKVVVSLRAQRGRGGKRAVIERVIRRSVDRIVGTFEQTGSLGCIRPLDSRVRMDFFLLPEDDSARINLVHPGDAVRARIISYPDGAEAGVAIIEERIGDASSADAGTACLMARYGLVDGYPAAAEAEAEKIRTAITAGLDDPLRRDLRDAFCITIDPVDARDFDDAIGVERVPGGGWRLFVHIADVSHYVGWGDVLDLEARRRGTSVYLADRVLPMLPEHLSCDVCSLRPGADRLAITVEILLASDGSVRSYHLYPSAIRSRVRTDYEAAAYLLDGEAEEPVEEVVEGPVEEAADGPRRATEIRNRALGAQAQAAREGVDLVEFLLAADEAAQARRRYRHRRGSIDFNLPEMHVAVDDEGRPVASAERRPTRATRLVEEAMLVANECVAEYLSDRGVACPYRVHRMPGEDSLVDAAALLTDAGALEWEDARAILAGTAGAFERVIECAAGTRWEPFVNAVLLRAQQRAVYAPACEGHFALGAPTYCHFTSPIRRYPDLLVHRVLKFELARERLSKREASARRTRLVGVGNDSLQGMCTRLCRDLSARERIADAAARASQRVFAAKLMAPSVGTAFEAAVSWVSDAGVFARTEPSGIEGMARLGSSLDPSEWEYDERRLRLARTDGDGAIAMGDRLLVRIERVDMLRGRIDLAIVGRMDESAASESSA